MIDRSNDENQDDRPTPLVQRFEHDYGNAYVRLVGRLKKSYPDITARRRRTGRALRNICLFVWFYARDGDKELIPTLFKTSVLLAAQDDYYDNRQIPTTEKHAFCSATNNFLRTWSLDLPTQNGSQVRELMSLWSEVARTIQGVAAPFYSYWSEKACQLNDAMAAENRMIRRVEVSFEEYMRAAIHSIGAVFVWSTYLVHKGVPLGALRDMDPTLLVGARMVRLSNDMASHRQAKNKRNAVALLGGGEGAARHVARLIEEDSRVLREQVHSLRVGPDVKRVILRSAEFSRELYRRSDFDKRALW